ncbi:MAG TPA: zinc ribbon domain-containing protein [Clostridia bacterium]|nr:zinc ribbon domain-containing protein [Clostridia bacterium]
MFCPKCGNQLPDGAKFCASCGNQLKGAPVPENSSEARANSQSNYSSPTPNTPPAYIAPNYQAQSFAPPAPQYNASYGMGAENEKPLTVGNYLIMMLITVIPIVGIVMMFIWAFGTGHNRNKKNWARATLIVGAISLVFTVIFYSSMLALLQNSFDSGYYYY